MTIKRVGEQERDMSMAFFEKVGGTLAAKSRDVADKAREMAEVNRLNGQIHSQESMAEKIYVEIGKLVYQNREDWQSMDVNSQLERLDAIGEEIARLQKEILWVKGIRKCENCGAEIDRNVSFCPKCGCAVKALKEDAEEVRDEGAVQEGAGEGSAKEEPAVVCCPGCNQEIEPGTVFCPFCGVKLK